MRGQSAIISLLALSLPACSTTFSAQQCDVDEDCGSELVCERREQQQVCIDAADATLRIGQSAPMSGPSQALGTEMKLGIDLAFAEKNAAGGIRGRKLELQFRDDAYQPERAEQAARSLVDARVEKGTPRCPTTAMPAYAGESPISMTAIERGPGAVLAFLGNVGTPTMVRSAPVAIESGTIFFGAFTGAATILRDDRAAQCNRYIFNVRASYRQEAYATVELFKNKGIADASHILSFDQNDSFGQAGYDGLVDAYEDVIGAFPDGADQKLPIARFRYTRNDDQSVPEQVSNVAAYLVALLALDDEPHTVGIMMTDTYGAAATFIEGLRRWQFALDEEQTTLNKAERLTFYFSNVSFVGPNALADRLVDMGTLDTPQGKLPFTENVIVSQVVPNYQSDTSETITAYNRLIAKADHTPSFTSLEGYIAARVFIAGLEAHKGPFDPKTLIDTFEQLPDLSLGIGASAGFSSMNHQYSNSVWGTTIEPDGSFENLYFWSAGVPIEFFE